MGDLGRGFVSVEGADMVVDLVVASCMALSGA